MRDPTALINTWRTKAADADAAADRVMTDREHPSWQVVGWRAQADTWRQCADQLSAIMSSWCEDCGVPITDQHAHTRFHSILSAQAWALSVLKNAHLAAHVHDKYDAVERINSKHFDSWSADALAEVIAENTATRSMRCRLYLHRGQS